MLIKSEDEGVQKRYIVKKNNAGEYQIFDTVEKVFKGPSSSNYEIIHASCDETNAIWKEISSNLGLEF